MQTTYNWFTYDADFFVSTVGQTKDFFTHC